MSKMFLGEICVCDQNKVQVCDSGSLKLNELGTVCQQQQREYETRHGSLPPSMHHSLLVCLQISRRVRHLRVMFSKNQLEYSLQGRTTHLTLWSSSSHYSSFPTRFPSLSPSPSLTSFPASSQSHKSGTGERPSRVRSHGFETESHH